MAEKGFWPLYEGKHIEQFLVDIKPIERWLSLEAAKAKYGRPPNPTRKVVFRDIASNTNERTCIAAVLPKQSCSGNTLITVVTLELPPEIVATVLNALPTDFSMRLRIAGTHLNLTYVLRLAVPPGDVAKHLPSCDTASASMTQIQHQTDLEENWPHIWEANRAVAEAYGLTPEDFAHILSTFPVLAKKRPRFFAFVQERLKGWQAEFAG
jgi:hypothetical protein